MNKGVVVSLFDYTGNMVRPWADAGYACYCFDIQHKVERQEGNITYLYWDAFCGLDWKPENVVFISAFPPCTHLAVSGARWFKGKGLHLLAEAIKLFAISADFCNQFHEVPWMIENPISTISTYWRKPDYTFDPCDYGDPYTKKTCLWTGDKFIMPPKNRVDPALGSKMHLIAPSSDRANKRSETPMGFANAVFKFNCKK